MWKNNKKEVINISLINKNKTAEEKSKQNDGRTNKDKNILNQSKEDNRENLPKIIKKKEIANNKDISNTIINKKRERILSHNKEGEEQINNNIANKRKMPLNEAKKEMKDFKLLIENTEKEIQKKYGIIFPDLDFEDNLPNEIKNKLIDNFLENSQIKNILNEINSAK